MREPVEPPDAPQVASAPTPVIAAGGFGGYEAPDDGELPSGPTPAVRALRAAGVAHQIVRYGTPGQGKVSGAEAAERMGLDPTTVLKTLVVEVGDDLVFALVPVPDRLDLAALGAQLGDQKATLARPEVVRSATGCELGAVSPFGHGEPPRCVVEASVVGRSRVYVSGGEHGLELGLAPEALVEVTGARVAPIVQSPGGPGGLGLPR